MQFRSAVLSLSLQEIDFCLSAERHVTQGTCDVVLDSSILARACDLFSLTFQSHCTTGRQVLNTHFGVHCNLSLSWGKDRFNYD